MIKLFFGFLICSQLFGQKPKIYLLIASDVKDTKYGVLTYGKIEKLNQMFKNKHKLVLAIRNWFDGQDLRVAIYAH